jgi:hypothetical protein
MLQPSPKALQEFMKVGSHILNAQFVMMFAGIMAFFMQLGQVQRVR